MNRLQALAWTSIHGKKPDWAPDDYAIIQLVFYGIQQCYGPLPVPEMQLASG
jgi:hypothetical protein